MDAALSTDDLNRLPEVEEEKSGFFDYQPLSEGAAPDVTAHHLLARRDSREGEEGGQRLRLALVTGYDSDANWMDVVSYQWRGPGDAVWARERWEDARGLLGLYTRDDGFGTRSAQDFHSGLTDRGADAVAEEAKRVLGISDDE